MAEKKEVWFLIDNLDKGWPTQRATSEDILILRALLEAARKLQRQIERKSVNFHCLVFLRNDIYEHLVIDTSDKGKDTAITLDWSDQELFKEIFRRRVEVTGLVEGGFDQMWGTIFDSAVGARDAFTYVFERTLARPRDFLSFLHRAIEVAVNRGHERVSEDDLLQAEKRYSEDMLKMMDFELRDIYPHVRDILYEFLGCNICLPKEEVVLLLRKSGLPEQELDSAIRLLAWFGFLGVDRGDSNSARFSYEIGYDMVKWLRPVEREGACFVVHPAFHSALECLH